MRHPDIVQFIEKHSKGQGHWSDHPDYPIEDWRLEIKNNDTRQGYWEWVYSQVDGE